MTVKTPLPRLGFSPGEFAKLFGKSQTWGYRQMYAGKVKTITEYGRILIPVKEVERILESAGIYNGRPPTASLKARLKKAATERQNVWRKFVEGKKAGKPGHQSSGARFAQLPLVLAGRAAAGRSRRP